MKKILGISFLIFLIFLLIINFVIVFNVSFFGYRIYKVSSKSMEPKLKYNDFILIKKSKSYDKNDIITFNVDGGTITSRIVEVKDERIISKGDAIDFNNDAITKDMIVGKMVYKFIVLTFINYFLFKPIFWVVFLLLGIFIFYFKMRKNYK